MTTSQLQHKGYKDSIQNFIKLKELTRNSNWIQNPNSSPSKADKNHHNSCNKYKRISKSLLKVSSQIGQQNSIIKSNNTKFLINKNSFNNSVLPNNNTLTPSLIQFEANKKQICSNLIRNDLQIQSKSLSDDGISNLIIIEEQPIICSSDLYLKNDVGWENRQMKNLTVKKFAGISFQEITKIKIKSQQPITGYYTLRITTKDDVLYQFGIRQSCLRHWFANAVWAYLLLNKIQTSINQHFKQSIQGWILKKSQFRKQWETRFIRINVTGGLTSAHDEQSTPTITIKKTNEVWTRFEIISQDKSQYIIIKLWHGFYKREFAVPIQRCISWLKAFAILII